MKKLWIIVVALLLYAPGVFASLNPAPPEIISATIDGSVCEVIKITVRIGRSVDHDDVLAYELFRDHPYAPLPPNRQRFFSSWFELDEAGKLKYSYGFRYEVDDGYEYIDRKRYRRDGEIYRLELGGTYDYVVRTLGKDRRYGEFSSGFRVVVPEICPFVTTTTTSTSTTTTTTLSAEKILQEIVDLLQENGVIP